MTAGKGVVFALIGRREGTQAAKMPIGVESLSSASKDFVSSGLVSDVPDNAVARRVEHIMQGNG